MYTMQVDESGSRDALMFLHAILKQKNGELGPHINFNPRSQKGSLTAEGADQTK
jgi:hypothetical protein